MDLLLLCSTTIISFVGFTMAFYGTFAQAMIDFETRLRIDKGIKQYSYEGDMYFAEKYKKWSAGGFFVSKSALIIGLIFVAISLIVNFLGNPWWSSLIVLVIGYFIYLQTAKIIGSKIQLISLFLGAVSLVFAIFKIMQ